MYHVVGLMRMLAIGYIFNDEELFSEFGRVIAFRVGDGEV